MMIPPLLSQTSVLLSWNYMNTHDPRLIQTMLGSAYVAQRSTSCHFFSFLFRVSSISLSTSDVSLVNLHCIISYSMVSYHIFALRTSLSLLIVSYSPLRSPAPVCCVVVRCLVSAATGDYIRLILTFLILYNNMMPISLYVSVDVVRVLQALAIGKHYTILYYTILYCAVLHCSVVY